MPHAQSAAQPALLIVHSDEASHAVEPGQGVVTIGREPHADVQIDDPTISQEHLRAECADGQWRVVSDSPSGMFVDGSRRTSVAVTDKTIIRLGDPTTGKALTFEVVKPSRPHEAPADNTDEHMDDSPADATGSGPYSRWSGRGGAPSRARHQSAQPGSRRDHQRGSADRFRKGPQLAPRTDPGQARRGAAVAVRDHRTGSPGRVTRRGNNR